MQSNSKYKIYKQLKYTPIDNLPSRILKFKRPCWKIVQKLNTKLLVNTRTARKKVFSNNTAFLNSVKKWYQLDKKFSINLLLKRQYYQQFNFTLGLNFFKKYIFLKNSKISKSLITYFLIKPKFRLDILLHFLNFFSSISMAQQEIIKKNIYVNNTSVFPNFFLKKGDIITFDTKFINNVQIHVKKTIFSFLEVDYYTKTIVIIKSLEELTENDISTMNTKYFEVKKLFDNIRYQ
jgi:ribosomal protein S4